MRTLHLVLWAVGFVALLSLLAHPVHRQEAFFASLGKTLVKITVGATKFNLKLTGKIGDDIASVATQLKAARGGARITAKDLDVALDSAVPDTVAALRKAGVPNVTDDTVRNLLKGGPEYKQTRSVLEAGDVVDDAMRTPAGQAAFTTMKNLDAVRDAYHKAATEAVRSSKNVDELINKLKAIDSKGINKSGLDFRTMQAIEEAFGKSPAARGRIEAHYISMGLTKEGLPVERLSFLAWAKRNWELLSLGTASIALGLIPFILGEIRMRKSSEAGGGSDANGTTWTNGATGAWATDSSSAKSFLPIMLLGSAGSVCFVCCSIVAAFAYSRQQQ